MTELSAPNTSLIRLPTVNVDDPANSSPTGLKRFELSLSVLWRISDPESPPAEKLPGVMSI